MLEIHVCDNQYIMEMIIGMKYIITNLHHIYRLCCTNADNLQNPRQKFSSCMHICTTLLPLYAV